MSKREFIYLVSNRECFGTAAASWTFLLQILKSPLDQRLHFCFTFTRCIIKQIIIIIIRGV